MRRYETIIIINPELSEEDRVPVLKKVTDLILKYDGFLILQDIWGDRKLAYEIKKKDRGFYVLFDYCGTGELVKEMERSFRIDEKVLKYMTVLLDNNADINSIKEEMLKKEIENSKSAEEKTEDEKLESEKDKSASEPVPDKKE